MIGELALPGEYLRYANCQARPALADGAGLAFVFEDYANEAIAAGQLVRLLDDWRPSFDGFYVYYASRRQMRPALRAFVDFFRLSK